jgi:hypothetical protein
MLNPVFLSFKSRKYNPNKGNIKKYKKLKLNGACASAIINPRMKNPIVFIHLL